MVLFFVLLSQLVSCTKKQPSVMEGTWYRLIKVPKTVQGRCFEETLAIQQDQWHLHVVMHSTFRCNQPFLAWEYEGDIDNIESQTAKMPLRLHVTNIRLVKMIDIASNDRQVLPNSALAKMDETFVGEKNRVFEQIIRFNGNKGEHVRANLYPAALNMAIEAYPDPEALLVYTRLAQQNANNRY